MKDEVKERAKVQVAGEERSLLSNTSSVSHELWHNLQPPSETMHSLGSKH